MQEQTEKVQTKLDTLLEQQNQIKKQTKAKEAKSKICDYMQIYFN
ncbi:hypothetical protein [Bacillus cereus]|nr:hypothetical protein [Bacillus cereus]